MKVHWWRGNRFQRFMPASHAKTPTTPFFQSGEAILWRYQVVAAGFQNRGVVRSDLPGSRLNIPCQARAEHEDLAVINRKIEFSKQHHNRFAQYGKITKGTKTEDILQKVTKGVSAWIWLGIRQLFVCFVSFCKNSSVFATFCLSAG